MTFRVGSLTLGGVLADFSHSEVGISKFLLQMETHHNVWCFFGMTSCS